MKLKKNDLEANKMRLRGNEHYKAGQFYLAMICYNKSLSHAVPGSREFSQAFANRSAVYMELQEYELCLENIKLAIDCGYPDDRLELLLKRREKCLDLMELHEPDPNNDPWTYFKLSHPANEKIPFVSKCVELRESKRFGRHLITTQALKAGDIICIEEPFHRFIMNSSRFSNCANCLKHEKLNLFPCCECNYSMYCSKDCMTKALRFHKFECQAIDVDPDIENDIFQVVHRVVLEGLGIFGRIEKLQKFMDEHSDVRTVFDFDLANASEVQREKNLLQAINSLQKNPFPDRMSSLLDQHVGLMMSITKNPKHQKFLDEFMRKQMEIVITNSFGLSSRQRGEVGSGIFALASFFNHSCAPNVSRIAVDGKLVFIASRPVEKHQQLFVCYRSNFFRSPKAERQDEILRSYRFKCVCEACSKNYPLIDDLPSTDANFVVPPSEIASTESARAELKINCDYINRHIKSYPNFEICTLMERNRELHEAIAQLTPFSP